MLLFFNTASNTDMNDLLMSYTFKDDMAFVTSPEPDVDTNGNLLSIANDMITLADDVIIFPTFFLMMTSKDIFLKYVILIDQAPPKQRLSVSFAIAQSSVLAIFEARIEKKVEEYKYIPEALAAYGKVHLSERQLGTMIGEVYVIRHDVNLHSEILDTPDFFWKQEHYEKDYKMVGFIKAVSEIFFA